MANAAAATADSDSAQTDPDGGDGGDKPPHPPAPHRGTTWPFSSGEFALIVSSPRIHISVIDMVAYSSCTVREL